MGKNSFINNKNIEKIVHKFSDLGMPKNLKETLDFLSEIESDDEEKDNTLYDVSYQPLVYPPNSTPPSHN